ncbi:hypothetical protein Tco_1259034, partial [Tanacetum coccineum]
MCYKTTLASDTLIDFQIDFSISIGEIVTHWFTLIVLSALRRSDNENMLSRSSRIRRILKDGGEGFKSSIIAIDLACSPRGMILALNLESRGEVKGMDVGRKRVLIGIQGNGCMEGVMVL